MTSDYICIEIYRLRIMGPAGETEKTYDRVIEEISEALIHAQDAVNDALPDSYYAKIEE